MPGMTTVQVKPATTIASGWGRAAGISGVGCSYPPAISLWTRSAVVLALYLRISLAR
ncbi:hypothetical protein BH11PSE7_BH11PSE7_25560 [soil metagenome]